MFLHNFFDMDVRPPPDWADVENDEGLNDKGLNDEGFDAFKFFFEPQPAKTTSSSLLSNVIFDRVIDNPTCFFRGSTCLGGEGEGAKIGREISINMFFVQWRSQVWGAQEINIMVKGIERYPEIIYQAIPMLEQPQPHDNVEKKVN